MGCCLLALVLAGAPRVGIIFYWLLRPALFDAAFTSWLAPVIGFFLLPWTTLMYVIVAPGGVAGFDWALIGLGVILDLGSYGGGGTARSRRRNRN
jgi:hypothetical protein